MMQLVFLIVMVLLLDKVALFQLLSTGLVVQTAVRLVTGLVHCVDGLFAGHDIEGLGERLVFLPVVEDGGRERSSVMQVGHLAALDPHATPTGHAVVLLLASGGDH